MCISIIKTTFGLLVALATTPAFGAEHLECMNMPFGEAEQAVLNKHIAAMRGDDQLMAAVQVALDSRARVCAYLNVWSIPATRLASQDKWMQVQWSRIPFGFNPDEKERLNAALMPMKQRLISIMWSSATAIAKGEEPPPPSPDKPLFVEFYPLLKAAKIQQTHSNESRLSAWLYEQGFRAAIAEAFSKE